MTDAAALQAQLDRMQALLDRYGITEEAAARTAPPKRAFFEATFSGPARRRKTAAQALEDAGYTVRPHDSIHDDDTDGWVTVEVDWTRDGPIDHGFQDEHLRKAQAAAEQAGYTVRTHGAVGAGTTQRA